VHFGDITVKNIYQSFTNNKMAAKASWHRNYVTVALCIGSCVSSHYCGVVKVDRPGQSVFEYSEDVPTSNLISLGDSRGRI